MIRGPLFCLMVLLAVPASAQLPSASATPDEGSLEELSFITGTWRGEIGESFVEEVWSAPRGGAMMGMFRWVTASGEPRVYEMLTISRENGEVFLRLRHFSSTMVAWEAVDEPLVLGLDEIREDFAAFTNISTEGRLERYVFHRPGEGHLDIDVHFRAETRALPLNFRLTRAQAP